MLRRQADHQRPDHVIRVARGVHVALEEASLTVYVDVVRQDRDRGAVGHVLLDVLHDGPQENRLHRNRRILLALRIGLQS